MKKNIIICGASKNLGAYISRKFSKDLYNVIKISSSLKKNIFLNVFRCDLGSASQTKRTLFNIKIKYKKIDGILFCVGNSKKMSKKELPKYFTQSLIVNFYTFVNLLNSYLDVYDNKKTNIVVISSIAGLKISSAPIEYSIAKSCLNFYTKYKAKELAKFNIKLNIVSPGNILMNNNNWFKKINKNKNKVYKYIRSNVPSKNFCNPDEIYEICKLLLDSKFGSNYIGSNIILDGGQVL
jgi:NAD(P)-dependent dehydrogenase (short-subunit alcohol dehydrogenase family)